MGRKGQDVVKLLACGVLYYAFATCAWFDISFVTKPACGSTSDLGHSQGRIVAIVKDFQAQFSGDPPPKKSSAD